MADEAHFALVLGPEGLAQPPGVGLDQARGRSEDVFGRAIVLFQPDYLRAFSNRRMLPTSAPRQP